MPEFSIGNIVRITRQPEGWHLAVVGKVGYIASLASAHASFIGLNLDGSMSGCGGVRLDCLEHETSPQWKRAKEIRDAESARSLAKSKERKARYEARMTELAAKYGISVENVWALKSDIEALGDQA